MPVEIVVDVDEQFEAGVDVAALEAVAVAVLAHEGIDDAALSIVVTDDETVRQLNRTYRDVDSTTDVLSFAAREGNDLLQDLPEELSDELERELGDVVIAFPYAERQAARYGNPVAAELMLLAAHGVLHLLGHDHATPEEEGELWVLQEQILAGFGVMGLSHRSYEE